MKIHKICTFVKNHLCKIDIEVLIDYEMNMIHCYILA